ncbi:MULTISPECIES: hypothetical protein [Rhodanobacter]|uniref:hypothetical protein n=1 Tax=Rhodanobacter TaxID=75309 RepID=UPI001CE17607|nr:hypothetical protein [Rhodanobacter sp. 7MK24]
MPLMRASLGALLLGLAGTPAWTVAATAPNHAGQQPQTAATSPPVYVGGLGQAVSAETLDRYSGGTSVRNNQNLSGTVSNNSATKVNTGSNVISANSFSGATGLPTVIQNTGNNVLIQNGVIVNVQFKP